MSVHTDQVEEENPQKNENTIRSSLSIGDYYDKCVNCHHGVCITEEDLASTKAQVDSQAKEFESFLDEVERMEFSLSTITSAFLQQKRALEKELLALDLAYSAVVQEQAESEAKREDFLKRAQKHVTQRNFLRRFAGQQQIQLVHQFGSRVYGKVARGGGNSDDTLFRPVVMDTSEAAPQVDEMVTSSVATDGELAVGGKQNGSGSPTKRSSSFYSQQVARRRQSSNESRRSTTNRSDSVTSDTSKQWGQRQRKTREPSTRPWDEHQEAAESDEADGGIEDVIRMIKQKNYRRRKEKGCAADYPDEHSGKSLAGNRRKSSSSVGGSRKPGNAGSPAKGSAMGGEGLVPQQSMRRGRGAPKPHDAILSDLDAADRAAEARSSEVEALIRRLDDSSVEQRSQQILEWYRAKLSDEAETRASKAAAEESQRKLEEERRAKELAESEVQKRKIERDKLLFSQEYSSFRKGALAEETLSEAPTSTTGHNGDDIMGHAPRDNARTNAVPIPPSDETEKAARKSIFDNPKYRLAAMRAMSGRGDKSQGSK